MSISKVLVTGYFNVLHPGHLRLFRFAKGSGDKLFVAVLSDRLSGDAAYVAEDLRLEGVSSNSWVDEAFLLDEPVHKFIAKFKPDIVVKGKEHESGFNPELEALEQYGGRLLFGSGEVSFSSVDLIRKEFYESNLQTINLPRLYLDRQKITLSRLTHLVQGFGGLNVCVIGDLIVDEYITCQPLGMSQEDPTIVVTPIDSTRFLGGAGIVAAHGAGLGANVSFISVTGDDEARSFAEETLASYGVDAYLLSDKSRPTTLKQRFRSKSKTLLRVSHLHQGAIDTSLQSELLGRVSECLRTANVLIFSDFNYGCLPQNLVDEIIVLARKMNVMMLADSQSSSQTGDISRFKDMDLITPTEREARISVRNSEDGLVILAEQLRQQSSAKNIFLTLGEEGILIHAGQGSAWLTDRISALNSAAKDVAGAGDSLLMTSALTLAMGGTVWETACLGSLTAAIQVGRVGNMPVRRDELMKELSF